MCAAPGLRTCLRGSGSGAAAGPREPGHVSVASLLSLVTPPPNAETAICCQGPGVAQGAVWVLVVWCWVQGKWIYVTWCRRVRAKSPWLSW